jgi:hypothetical protein
MHPACRPDDLRQPQRVRADVRADIQHHVPRLDATLETTHRIRLERSEEEDRKVDPFIEIEQPAEAAPLELGLHRRASQRDFLLSAKPVHGVSRKIRHSPPDGGFSFFTSRKSTGAAEISNSGRTLGTQGNAHGVRAVRNGLSVRKRVISDAAGFAASRFRPTACIPLRRPSITIEADPIATRATPARRPEMILPVDFARPFRGT